MKREAESSDAQLVEQDSRKPYQKETAVTYEPGSHSVISICYVRDCILKRIAEMTI